MKREYWIQWKLEARQGFQLGDSSFFVEYNDSKRYGQQMSEAVEELKKDISAEVSKTIEAEWWQVQIIAIQEMPHP